jgi:PAS domain S-box-containing protein
MTRRLAAAILVLTAALAACGVALVVASDHDQGKVATIALAAPLGVAFVVSGLVAWSRWPENRTGPLLVATGLTWFLGALGEANDAFVASLGAALGAVSAGFFFHAVLAYPTGRLETRLNRILAGIVYAVVAVQWTPLLFDDEGGRLCEDCPENVFLLWRNPALADAIGLGIAAAAAAAILAALAVLVGRWLRATPALRRVLAPVYLTGTVAFAWGIVELALAAFFDVGDSPWLWAIGLATLLAVPLALLFGLLRTRLARVGAARLLLETPDEPTLEEAQEGLRRALGDPTLLLLYWDADRRTYVDAAEDPYELPPDSNEVVTTMIEYEGRRLAALVHDAALRREEPDLLEDVVATARVALEKDRTLRALRATERRSGALLSAIPDNMFRITRDGGYLDASIKNERYLPVPAAELPHRNVREMLPPVVADLILGAVGRALDSGEAQTVEYRMQRPVGLRDSEARIVASGENEAVIIVRDITERKAQEAALERERDFIRTVVNSAPGFFVVLDLDGSIVRFNDSLAATSGRPDDERARGRPFWELFVAPEDADGWREAFERAVAGGEPLDLEAALVTTSDERRFVLWRSTPIVDENGDRKQLVTGDDVTERHHHGAELERQRNFLNAIANNAPSLLCLIDDRGILAERASNIAFERTLEYDPSDTGGDVFWDKYVHPDDAGAVRELIERVIAGEPSREHDHRWITSTGRSLVIAWSCTPLPQIDERRLFLLSGVDVSERKRQELELERQRDFLSALGDASPSLLVVVDPEGRIGHDGINLTARELTGYRQNELDGRPFWEVFPPPEEAERVRRLIEEAVATGGTQEYETHWLTKAGERRLVAWSCTRMPELERRLEAGDEELGPAGLAAPYLVAGSDVTERVRQRDELRRERDFLSMIANATPSLLAVVDADGRITEEGVNRAFGLRTGYGDTEARGRGLTGLVVVPEDREAFAQALADVAAGGPSIQHESRWVTRSGEQLLVEWTAIPLESARENQFLIAATDVTDRKRQEAELRRSRARLVEAGDLERRRLERNLHDGAQQRLVSLSLSLRLAQSKLRTDPLAAGPILEGASTELAHALEELRELARGIHPAVLSDRGLGPALESLADRAPLPVELVAVPEERLPGPVEAAAFYVVSEALTNVAKYAKASLVRVRIEQLNGYALVEVADDGVGGADPSGGTGLRGLADRVAALDGHLEVESPEGEGTRIRAAIPMEG